MNARDVYEKQEALREAEWALDRLGEELARADADAARHGTPVGSMDWMNAPSYREALAAIGVKRAEVRTAQERVGGVVYLVHEEHIARVEKKVASLVKRATRTGHTVEYRRAMEETEPAKFGQVTVWHYLTLKGEEIKLADWVLLGKLSIEEAGVMIGAVPGCEAVLGMYANLETASNCEYCGKARRRTATYLVEHSGSGEIRQVGSNCLRDFLGIDPHASIRYFELLGDMELELRSGGSGVKTEWATEWYLGHVCTMIRTCGWAPKSAEYPTATEAWNNMLNQSTKAKDKVSGLPLWIDPSDADLARAKAALAWADEHLGAKVNVTGDATDFDRNLYVAAKNPLVTPRTEGTLAYLPVAHAKFEEREIEYRKRREATANSKHVGTVGDRLELTLTVANIWERESEHGVTFITKMLDGDGNSIKWFGSYGLTQGETYIGKWTVKAHGEFKGTAETTIFRPAGLRPASEPAPAPRKQIRNYGDSAPVVVNGEQVGEVVKCVGGFEAVVNGERSDRAERRNQAEATAYQMHLDQKHAAERRAYLAAGLPEGLEVARGCPRYQEHLDFAKHVRPGDAVAVVESKSDFPYGSEWALAKPPRDNAAELTFLEVEVYASERDGQMRMRLTLPDGTKCPLGEQEMIRRPYTLATMPSVEALAADGLTRGDVEELRAEAGI